MRYRYYFSIILLLILLTASLLVMSVCTTGDCSLKNVGFKMVTNFGETSTISAFLVVLLFVLLFLLISLLIFSIFVYLKRRHTLAV